ncbi:virion protein [Dinoroseobacter phage DS-1410Ws-06]|uniref:Virion protein n=1 Tax=Dinoroseobacter phage DS-1410Ws-06 TaxID=1815983 RepID=A0A191VY95_9CAUD|nr:virion protein [Dinoroseobacter phage DS-1410Ws-06]ANJ20687.1 virion protein [Dinoroseobacter phage DS-1410Ws-06]
MAERRPLVLVNGAFQELPVGDTLPGAGGLQNNLAATTAPAVGNDNTEGYAVGSVWIDVTNDNSYVCLDASTGAAVWGQTNGAGGGASNFLSLTDTPGAFGTAGQFLAINSAADAIEFVDAPSGGGGGGASTKKGFFAWGNASAAGTLANWNNEVWDSEDAFDPVTGIYTVPASLDGEYLLIIFNVRGNTGGAIYIQKDTAGNNTFQNWAVADLGSSQASASVIIQVATGDQIRAQTFGFSAQNETRTNFGAFVMGSGGGSSSGGGTSSGIYAEVTYAANHSPTTNVFEQLAFDQVTLDADSIYDSPSGHFIIPESMNDTNVILQLTTQATNDNSGAVECIIEKSTDGGTTWSRLGQSPNGGIHFFGITNAIAVDRASTGDRYRAMFLSTNAITLRVDNNQTRFTLAQAGGGSSAQNATTDVVFDFDATGEADTTTPIDKGVQNLAVTNNGVAVLSERYEFESTNGNGEWFSVPAAATEKLGNSDFVLTVERLSFDAFPQQQGVVGEWEATGNQRSWILFHSAGQLLFYGSSNGASQDVTLSYNFNAANTEIDVIVRRVGGTITLEINGAVEATANPGAGYTFFDSSANTIEFGTYAPGSRDLDGSFRRATLTITGANLDAGVPISFLTLPDTPETYGTVGQMLVVNGATNGLEWTDVPADELPALGAAGQILAVNGAANGVEWIDAPAGGSGASYGTPDYGNPGGTGNRTGLITASTNAVLGGGTTVDRSIDGAVGTNSASAWYWNSGQNSGLYVRWDFGSKQRIDQIRWQQNNTAGHGTWRVEGSDDASTWTPVSSNFALGGSTDQTIDLDLIPADTGYRYYQIAWQSGSSTSNSPWLQETEFRLAPESNPSELPAGGTAGQLLAKVDATDGNVEWIDPPAGGSGEPNVTSWNDLAAGVTPTNWIVSSGTPVTMASKGSLTPRTGAVFAGVVAFEASAVMYEDITLETRHQGMYVDLTYFHGRDNNVNDNVRVDLAFLDSGSTQISTVGTTDGNAVAENTWERVSLNDTLIPDNAAFIRVTVTFTRGQGSELNAYIDDINLRFKANASSPDELPALGTPGQVLAVNGAGDGVEWKADETGAESPATGDGVSDSWTVTLATANSTSAFALKGNIVTMTEDRWLTAVDMGHSTNNLGQTVDLFVAKLSEVNPGTITEIVLDVGQVSISDPIDDTRFTVPNGGLHLENGVTYVIAFVRTDATGADALQLDFPSGGTEASSFFTHNGTARAALNAPALTNTVYFNNTAAVKMDIITEGYVAPASPGDMVQTEITGATYSTQVSDFAGNVVRRMNSASGQTVTVEPDITGQPVTFIQAGAGTVTFAAGTGVTINSLNSNLAIAGQYGSVTLIPDVDTANTFYLVGALA